MRMKWAVRVIYSCVCQVLSKLRTDLSETHTSLFSSNFLSYCLPMEWETRASIGLEVWDRVYLGHQEVPGPMQLYQGGKGGVFSFRWVTIGGRGTTPWAGLQRSKTRVEFRSCSPWQCAQHTGSRAQWPDEGPAVCRTLKSANALLAESESIGLSGLYACCTKSLCHLLAPVQAGRKSYHKYNFKQTFLLRPDFKYL